MSNPNSLFLLADHIKLSLLERQRAKSLNLESDSQDGHISRSLDQLRDGVEKLQTEQKRLEDAGDEARATNIADSIPALQKQLGDLTSQFHGFSTPSSSNTLTHPNDPALAPDFAHATSIVSEGTQPPQQQPTKKSLRTSLASPTTGTPKSVRFSDNPPADVEAQQHDRAALFGTPTATAPYRDDPEPDGEGYRDQAAGMSNVQIHAFHSRVLAEQDEQLDALGASIGRQRELSMRIGDELDSQVVMLDEGERLVDRHQGALDRARRQVGRIARGAGENKQMTAIVVLIVILVLLIVILK